jgi:hypothetical protein
MKRINELGCCKLALVLLLSLTVLDKALGQSAQSITLLNNVYVTWQNLGDVTNFQVTSRLGNGVSPSNAWV